MLLQSLYLGQGDDQAANVACAGIFDQDAECCCTGPETYGLMKQHPATNRAVVEPGRRTAPDFDGRPVPVAVGFENEGALTLAGMANEARDAETLAALQSIADHVANEQLRAVVREVA
jgi:hypothetical protein